MNDEMIFGIHFIQFRAISNGHSAGWQKLRDRISPKGQGLLWKEGPQHFVATLIVAIYTLFERLL